MSIFAKTRSILAASYPELWAYTGFVFIAGALVAVKGGGRIPLSFIPYAAWFFVGANLFGMLLNDYFDRELDAHNPRKTKTPLAPRDYALGIGAALLSYTVLTILFPNVQAAVWVAVAVAANAAYSIPPLRLKERPPFDILGGPASYLTALLAGYALGGGGWPSAVPMLAGFLFFSALELAHKTLDIEADARGKIRTSATILGRRRSLVVAVGLMLASGALVGLYNPLYSLAAFPYLAVFSAFRNTSSDETLKKLNARLPVYYSAAGFVATLLYWTL